jgi:hypothetical protein
MTNAQDTSGFRSKGQRASSLRPQLQCLDKLDLTSADRRRLAILGKELGRKLLAKVATLATQASPAT